MSEPDLRQDFYADLINECVLWLRVLAKKDAESFQPLREEIGRIYAWASVQCDVSERVLQDAKKEEAGTL